MNRSKFLKSLPLIGVALLTPLGVLSKKKPESTTELIVCHEDEFHHFVQTIDRDGEAYYLDGKVVSFREWDRMLSADEISRLYGGYELGRYG